MPPAPHELGAAVMATLDQLVAAALGTQVSRTDGKPLTDVVYSQLHLGELIDPRDFADPWSPIGGASVARADGPPPPPPPAGQTQAPPPNNDETKRALQAAFNTCEKVDTLLEVTRDGL